MLKRNCSARRVCINWAPPTKYLKENKLKKYYVYITVYCISVQNCQAERHVTNHTKGVNQTTEALKLTNGTPGVRLNPG